jgi:predicted RNA-binding Zn ribbon-like protein
MEPAPQEGWSAVIANVLISYGALITDGHIRRVRSCANPDCTFLFYDESRNGSRQWCDPARCGNLLAVRRHRSQAQQ